jgi:hypothetical protein
VKNFIKWSFIALIFILGYSNNDFLFFVAMKQEISEQALYDELSYYTLAHPSPAFIHQHIVDAFAAQTADKETKPIKITFALVGLYLYLEKQYTGKMVQQAHMVLAKYRKDWPHFSLPKDRGRIRVAAVLASRVGKQRDDMIRKWCVSVWEAYEESHEKVAALVAQELA